MKNKLIFIELNEINFDLVKKYSLNYTFKVFNEDFFKKLKKTKSEDEYNLLEPWIQWVSIHTGLTAREHKIYRLGDFDRARFYFKLVFSNPLSLNIFLRAATRYIMTLIFSLKIFLIAIFLLFDESFFESSIKFNFFRLINLSKKIIAQLTTGPANGPLPTSSMAITLLLNDFSILKSGKFIFLLI